MSQGHLEFQLHHCLARRQRLGHQAHKARKESEACKASKEFKERQELEAHED